MNSLSLAIQMKATEQSLLLVLCSMLYKVVLSFKSVDEILKCGIQMKATEKFFPVEAGSIRNVRMSTQMTIIILL